MYGCSPYGVGFGFGGSIIGLIIVIFIVLCLFGAGGYGGYGGGCGPRNVGCGCC